MNPRKQLRRQRALDRFKVDPNKDALEPGYYERKMQERDALMRALKRPA